MGCLFALLAAISARLALGLLWIFTKQVDQAFDETWVPIVGFFLFPWTTLVYALVWTGGVVSTGGWVLVAFAIIADVSSWAGKAHVARRR